VNNAPRLLVVVGARPNFVKVAPVVLALEELGGLDTTLLHTGQHYDRALSDSFLDQLGFPELHHHLGVGSGSHAVQTAAVLTGVERVLQENPHDAVLVSGDVNSTMAAGLAATKLGVKVIHLESGLRSADWTMPEEVNRAVTDRISDLLLCTSADAVENLKTEGVDPDRIALVGNTMIDSLFRLLDVARDRGMAERLGLAGEDFVLVTLHRPALVDFSDRLADVLGVLSEIGRELPVVFPAHPRTLARVNGFGKEFDGIRMLDPLDYLDFIAVEAAARLVVTDSGGVQEETSALGVPCLTYRTTTERPVTIELGTNRLVGVDPEALRRAAREVLEQPRPAVDGQIPLWDGHAGERAASEIVAALATR
jgi:UDP-N-acetylglucosamine 2-epimerase (non-hydrolysing)